MSESVVVFIDGGVPDRVELLSNIGLEQLEQLLTLAKSMQAKSAILSELQKKIQSSVKKTMVLKPEDDDPVLPEGKHAGKRLSELKRWELHGVWAGWNGSHRLRKHPIFPALTRAKNGFLPEKSRTQSVSASQVKSTNDVDMSGREGEESPFDA